MKPSAIAALVVVSIAASACATTQNPPPDKGNMLSAAGFKMRMADSPARIASLKSLPPNEFTVKSQNGQPVFIYADPTVCGCLYVGNQDAFSAYQQMVFQQKLVKEQEMTAMMNEQASFDLGPWGPPFY
ncbi:hypothetical protein [Ancylobacter sp. TS-1]|uniref:hypothetical protein n=1 Tax=Ancylobacter sp. TS-1 TaxID=1850374 RepID=UPI001265D513|nr:hypothetical protein [Ancylobacter sp. TS-1]QFR32253.1 hypothetical protein GBB76_03505 [Ancylobacter sp. TS-1]